MLVMALAMVGAGRAAAASQQETRDYEAVIKDFEITEWGRAEEAAAKFIKKYGTNSENFARVVLFDAQAQFKQKKYIAMVELLTVQQGQAGSLGDQFTYWLAQGYYHRADYHAAADTFARLVKDYPASALRPEAVFSEAEARSQLKDWVGVAEVLSKPDGAFAQLAKTSPGNEWVVRGQLLLGEAQAHQADYAGAAATLQGMAPVKTNAELEWRRLFLLCEAQLTAGHKEEARQTSVNLIAAAQTKPDWLAESKNLQGRILEELDLLPEAVKTYDEINQNDAMPAAQRRRAFLNSVELILRQNKVDEAEQKLTDYSNTHPEPDTNGLEALTLGELKLRRYYQAKSGGSSASGDTNSLTLAKVKFEGIIGGTNTEYLGKAELNLGWCLWEEKKYPESLAAFSNAVQRLPFSTEQAVARFKVGDALYELKDYAGAAGSYGAVIDQYGTLTAVKNELFERALYQLLRAVLEQTNLAMATGAMNRILEWFPDGLMGQPSLLLVGQGWSSQGNTAEAQKVFADFIARFPQSPLLPEVKLAIARTYEAKQDWPHAMAEYDAWVGEYPKSLSLPRAEFARALVNYEAGRETNAFMLFTNFVAQYPSNELALKAQYWVGDYYWRQQDFVSAEAQYQEVYKNKNRPGSKLQYEALMMAGRAAMARENYREAIGYFTNLVTITNCPLDLRFEALFAAGDAKMASATTASLTNLSTYTEAVNYNYKPIVDDYSSNRLAALAWGRMGDCYCLLAGGDAAQFNLATNAYQQVINSALADISARSMAECGLAKALEGMARLKPVGMQREGLVEAVGHYLNVAEGKNRRNNETPDAYWVKEAGKAAGALDQELGEWDKAAALYYYLAEDMPSWKSYWDKRIEEVNKAREKQGQTKPAGGN